MYTRSSTLEVDQGGHVMFEGNGSLSEEEKNEHKILKSLMAINVEY